MLLNLNESIKIICEQRRIKPKAKATKYQHSNTLFNFDPITSIKFTQRSTFKGDIFFDNE